MIPNTENTTGQLNKSARVDTSSDKDFLDTYLEEVQKKRGAERTKRIAIPLQNRKLAPKTASLPSKHNHSDITQTTKTTETNTKSTASNTLAMDITMEINDKRLSNITPPSDQESPLNQKRIRFSIPDPLINVTPFSTFVDQQLTPHDIKLSLSQAIRPLARQLATEFKKLCNRQWELLNKISKFAAGGFIPNSLHFVFTLGASDVVIETYKIEYNVAVLKAEVALKTYQKDIISTMVDILELELKILN